MDNDQALSRAYRANQLLNDPLFAEAFEAVRRDLISKWLDRKTEDSQERERLYLQIKNLDAVRQNLIEAISNGKVAQASLDVQKKLRTSNYAEWR